jgi:hypothetical protein
MPAAGSSSNKAWDQWRARGRSEPSLITVRQVLGELVGALAQADESELTRLLAGAPSRSTARLLNAPRRADWIVYVPTSPSAASARRPREAAEAWRTQTRGEQQHAATGMHREVARSGGIAAASRFSAPSCRETSGCSGTSRDATVRPRLAFARSARDGPGADAADHDPATNAPGVRTRPGSFRNGSRAAANRVARPRRAIECGCRRSMERELASRSLIASSQELPHLERQRAGRVPRQQWPKSRCHLTLRGRDVVAPGASLVVVRRQMIERRAPIAAEIRSCDRCSYRAPRRPRSNPGWRRAASA